MWRSTPSFSQSFSFSSIPTSTSAPPRVLSTPFFTAWHSVFLPFRTIVDLNSPRAALSCHPALVGVSSSLFFSYSTFLPSGSANLLLFLLLRRLLLRILHFFELLHFSLLFLASRKIQFNDRFFPAESPSTFFKSSFLADALFSRP